MKHVTLQSGKRMKSKHSAVSSSLTGHTFYSNLPIPSLICHLQFVEHGGAGRWNRSERSEGAALREPRWLSH